MRFSEIMLFQSRYFVSYMNYDFGVAISQKKLIKLHPLMNLAGRSHDSYYISLVDLLTLPSPLKDKKWGKDNQLSSTTLEITTQLAVKWYSGCLAIWPPGCLAAWLSGRLGHICQKPLLSGPPLPACRRTPQTSCCWDSETLLKTDGNYCCTL